MRKCYILVGCYWASFGRCPLQGHCTKLLLTVCFLKSKVETVVRPIMHDKPVTYDEVQRIELLLFKKEGWSYRYGNHAR